MRRISANNHIKEKLMLKLEQLIQIVPGIQPSIFLKSFIYRENKISRSNKKNEGKNLFEKKCSETKVRPPIVRGYPPPSLGLDTLVRGGCASPGLVRGTRPGQCQPARASQDPVQPSELEPVQPSQPRSRTRLARIRSSQHELGPGRARSGKGSQPGPGPASVGQHSIKGGQPPVYGRLKGQSRDRISSQPGQL